MGYSAFIQKLIVAGYSRVERDNRLLDIFPRETNEKGVELWEKWEENSVHIMRVRLPFSVDAVTQHKLARQEVESALQQNITLPL